MSAPTPDHTAAIREALLSGNKILAIRLYREQTGLGLSEAKDAVERLAVELGASSPDRFVSTVSAPTGAPTPDHAAIQEALFGGRKIEAIRLYRQQTGAALKEAKEAVEKLEAELRTSSPDRFQKAQAKGCFAVIAVSALLGGVIWWVAG